MSDKPNVLRLDVAEWKNLTIHNIVQLGNGISQLVDYLQKQNVISNPIIAEIDNHWAHARAQIDRQWDEVKLRLQGWERISRPLITEYELQQAMRAPQPAQSDNAAQPMEFPQAISASPPAAEVFHVKRGGWPKGKPRKPKAKTAQSPSAAVLPPVTQ